MATAVMKRRGGHEVNVGRPRKKPRSKAYTTGLAIDNALRTTTGAGFEQFLPPPAEFAAPAEWKFLSMAPDQGPDVVALTQWLLHKQRINLEVTWDLNHGSWNDIKLMYRDAGLWPHILLMTAAQNVGFGSELSPNRMKQIRQCFADYQCICNPRTCPVFQHFLPLILAEQKSLVRLSYEGQAEDEVWNNMRNDPVLTNMGERVNLGRCLGSVRRTALDLPCWSKRAWVYTVAAMMMGYEGTTKMRQLAEHMKERLCFAKCSPLSCCMVCAACNVACS